MKRAILALGLALATVAIGGCSSGPPWAGTYKDVIVHDSNVGSNGTVHDTLVLNTDGTWQVTGDDTAHGTYLAMACIRTIPGDSTPTTDIEIIANSMNGSVYDSGAETSDEAQGTATPASRTSTPVVPITTLAGTRTGTCGVRGRPGPGSPGRGSYIHQSWHGIIQLGPTHHGKGGLLTLC